MLAVLCAMLLSVGVDAQPSGKVVFEGKGNCHVCHGRNAKGTPLAPDLTDEVWINIDGTVATIRKLVESGVAKPKKYSAPMPPMGGAKLKPEEMDAVAGYVFGLSHIAVARESARRSRDRVDRGERHWP
jgi:mono/diheme cytochrome c family protein